MLGLLVTLGLAAPAAANRLVQLPGGAGCIVPLAVDGCAVGNLGAPEDIVVRGNHAYVTSSSENLVRVLDLDPATGAATMRSAGPSGCIADNGAGTGCADGRGLLQPTRMALSPDGLRLYVITANRSLAVLTRDPATGALSQSGAPAACMSQAGTADCAGNSRLEGITGIAVSPDGNDVYLTGWGSTAKGLVTALDVVAGGVQQADPATGGCFQHEPSAGCLAALGLEGATDVVVSPDGKHVYTSAYGGPSFVGQIAVFSRGADGKLAQGSAPDACVARAAGAQGCAVAALVSPSRAIVFASDETGYVDSQESVLLVKRNPQTGVITVPGACVGSSTVSPWDACSDVQNLFGISELAVTGDGALMVSARAGRGLSALNLAADGAPSASPAPGGCLATGGSTNNPGATPCNLPRGFARGFGQDFGPTGLALSDDRRFVYGVSRSGNTEDRAGLVAARRDLAAPVCPDATINMSTGQQVQLPLVCSDADGDAFTRTVLSTPAVGITGQLDHATGTIAYAAPDQETTVTLVFKATSNGVESAPGTLTINVTKPAGEPGGGGAPGGGGPGGGGSVERLVAVVRAGWDVYTDGLIFTRLIVVDVPPGAKVEVRCKGRGCPFKRRSFTPTKRRVVLTRAFRKRKLRKGARLELRTTKPGAVGNFVSYRVRAGKDPVRRRLCLPVGSLKPARSC